MEQEKNEAKIFRENPSLASEELQRKYLWISEAERNRPSSFEGQVPAWFEIKSEIMKNPFTGEEREIQTLSQIPQKTVQERIDELKQKVVLWTATEQEKEDLKLLIG